VLDNKSISKSKFFSVIVIDDDASWWAAIYWGLRIVWRSAAVAAMDEEIKPSAYLFWPLRIKIKRTRTGSSFMHNIFAVAKLISRSGKRTNISGSTLLIRIKVTVSSSGITFRINIRISTSSYESSRILIEFVSHWSSIWHWTAAIDFTVWFSSYFYRHKC